MHPIVKNRIMGCYENHTISHTHNPNVFIFREYCILHKSGHTERIATLNILSKGAR